MGILIQDVSKRYGTQGVLDRVTLEITPGEMFVLLGASGSGKSTLLRLIAGLSIPDEGRISLAGRDVTELRPQERGTGFVFQNYSVFRHMTVAQNIEFGMKLRHVPRVERARRRDELLQLVGLPGFASREAVQLSGGQQQRVAIARALAYEPKVLLLDEPFGALDVKIRHQLRRNLRAIHDRLRITTVLVTHDQDEAFELSDRVGLMDRGRLVEVGRAEDLYARPRTLFAATFLGSGTLLMGRIRGGQARFEGLDFGITPPTPHPDGAYAHLLLRPEDLAVSARPPAAGQPSLGSGSFASQSFAGATRRVRIRLDNRPEVHPASSPAPGPDGVLVEAVVPSQQPLPESPLWVSIERWHFLDPPPASLLVADDGHGPAWRLQIAGDLARALGARVTLLGVAADARHSDQLGWRLKRRQGAAGLADAELRVRYGNPAQQILQEQAELLSQMIVIPARDRPFGWLERLTGGAKDATGAGATIATVLENTRVPVLVVAGPPRPWRQAAIVGNGNGAVDSRRFLERITGPLGITVTTLETESELGKVPDTTADLIVAPIARRGAHEQNQIGPMALHWLAIANRPVLVIPGPG